MGSKKASVFEEAASEGGTVTDAVDGGMDTTTKAREVIDGRVGQGGVIQMIPQGFHGIEFGGVGGQPYGGKPGAVLLQSLLDTSAPVSREPVPHQDHALAAMTPERMEEAHKVRAFDPAGMYGQHPSESIGIRCGQDQADAGESLPVERFVDDRSLPPRSPCGADRGSLGEAGFVQESQPSVQPAGVFFTRGHSCRTHRAIAASSRSLARRAGRWRLQPSWPKIRHAWGRE